MLGPVGKAFFFFQFHKTFPFHGAPGGFRLGSHVALALLAAGCFPGWGAVSLAMGRVLSVLPPCCSQGSSQTPAAALASCLCFGLAWWVPCLSFPIFGKAAPHGGWWGHPGEAAEPLVPAPQGVLAETVPGETEALGMRVHLQQVALGAPTARCPLPSALPAPSPCSAGCAAAGYHPHGIFTPSLHPRHAAPWFGTSNADFCWR